jgi:lysophospholipase L1-like esterase
VAGDTTWGILARLHETTILKPGWVFLQAGINDLARGSAPADLISRLSRIWSRISLDSPGTRIGVLNLLPLCPERLGWTGFSLNNPLIRRVNSELRQAASGSAAVFLDLYSVYADHKGDLSSNFTQDGLHLLPDAYGPWTDLLLRTLRKESGSGYPAASELNEGPPAGESDASLVPRP